MKVQLHSITPNIEETIVEIARVSSSRLDKTTNPSKLIKYLIDHLHWSPFEMGHMTFEIETSKAIAIQLLRHRSCSFQEFSQRYQDIHVIDNDIFEPIEIRRQAESNRQSSDEVFDPIIKYIYKGYKAEDGHYEDVPVTASDEIDAFLASAESLYNELIKIGVAKEVARMVLPMCTKTKLYMTGSVRSWIHIIQIRDDVHAQKEIQLIAQEIKGIFKQNLPNISQALNW